MTKQEILAMKPGRELNIRVAEEVMGSRFVIDETMGDMEIHPDSVYGPLEPYSEDISAAWRVVERLISLIDVFSPIPPQRLSWRSKSNSVSGRN